MEWFDHIVASRLQTLRDVAVARMGTVAVIAGDGEATSLIDALVDSALADGFVVAMASLAEHGLQDLHAVVGALAASMRTPRVDVGRRHGVIAALDAFASAHGRSAEALFEESGDEEAVGRELCLLAREYIASASGTGPARKLQAWLGGRNIARETDELRPLSARTAKRALADLTRLVRALGHRGTRIVLRDAEALIDLSPGRRDVAYTVLREIIDNADGGHGVVACETLLVGTGDLDRRVHSLFDHPALATRIVADLPPGPPIPHQTWIALSPDDPAAQLPPVPKPYETSERHASQLAALVRIAQGL
ncbi:MAG TPA: BREX system ATP-binding domain-containing protein, partial [Polyangiaceae bacterium]|nr:BREX system ATP-binding domain-containing protein [Polyangiaceae bacterium]